MSEQNDEQAADDTAEGDDEDTAVLEFTDTVELNTSKENLWENISDPEILTECVPGAESIERVSERKYTVEITRGVSHLTVSLSGEAEFVEMNPPDYIVTSGHAFDSKTGSDFDILAAMEINEVDEETSELTYKAEVEFSGGVASINTRIFRPVVERDVNSYFDNVRQVVEDGT
jgi:carbon monoxide dehydrogenase subunit G